MSQEPKQASEEPSEESKQIPQAGKSYYSSIERIKQESFSIPRYISAIQFGESGYYNGKVAFIEEKKSSKGDFATRASDSKTRKVFAANMAYQLFKCRQKMISRNLLKTSDVFNVMECGAGEGHLSAEILNVIATMAERDKEWAELFNTIRYTILEKSPELSKRQKIVNSKYSDKIEFLTGDAMKMKKSIRSNSMAVIFSNELLDMFPPHSITLNDKGGIEVETIMPTIKQEDYTAYFADAISKTYTKKDSEELTWAKLKERSDELLSCSCDIFPVRLYERKNEILLGRDDFLKLHKIYAADKRFEPGIHYDAPLVFDFCSIEGMSVNFFPRLKRFLESNPTHAAELKPGAKRLVVVGMEDFVTGAANSLMDGGFLLSVDYGGDRHNLERGLRTYYNRRKNTNIKKYPGYLDITMDVDFHSLVKTGNKCGVDLVKYTTQSCMPNEEFKSIFSKTGAGIISKEDIEHYSKISSSFKVCLQTKHAKRKKLKARRDSFFSGTSLPVAEAKKNLFKKENNSSKCIVM